MDDSGLARKNFVETEGSVHSILHPIQVRESDIFKFLYFDELAKKFIEVENAIWTISPLGIELKSEATNINEIIKSSVFQVNFSNQKIKLNVVYTGKSKDNKLVGFKFVYPKVVDYKRSKKRWITNNLSTPTGSFMVPGELNEVCYFNINDVSFDGLSFTTSLRNKILFNGLKFEANVLFPLMSKLLIKLEIVNVNIIQVKNMYKFRVGCKFIDKPSNFSEVIGNYLFQFGDGSSLRSLKEDGFKIIDSKYGFNMSFVKTESEYNDVLKLRELCYTKKNTLNNFRNFSDIYDSRSRIIIAKHKSKVVGSCRVIFNNSNEEFEHFQFLDKPKNFPDLNSMVELTRICTHPDFRKGDLLIKVLQTAGKVVMLSGKKYVLGCSKPNLINIYKKIGFEDTGYTFNHADLGGKKHHLIMGKPLEIAVGRNVNPIVWNLVWSELVEYLIENEQIELSEIDKVRINLFRLFKPITSIIKKFKR